MYLPAVYKRLYNKSGCLRSVERLFQVELHWRRLQGNLPMNQLVVSQVTDWSTRWLVNLRTANFFKSRKDYNIFVHKTKPNTDRVSPID